MDVKATVFINVYVYRTKSHGVSNANPPPCRPSLDLSSHLCSLLRPPDRSLFCLYRNVVVKDPAMAGANREDAQQETSTGREDEHLCVTIALGRWPDPASPISPDFTIIKGGCIRRRPDLSVRSIAGCRDKFKASFYRGFPATYQASTRTSSYSEFAQRTSSRRSSDPKSRVSDVHSLDVFPRIGHINNNPSHYWPNNPH